MSNLSSNETKTNLTYFKLEDIDLKKNDLYPKNLKSHNKRLKSYKKKLEYFKKLRERKLARSLEKKCSPDYKPRRLSHNLKRNFFNNSKQFNNPADPAEHSKFTIIHVNQTTELNNLTKNLLLPWESSKKVNINK